MDRIIWSLVLSTTVLSAGHHVDHALRHHIGWPLSNHVTPFTYALFVYVAIAVGAVLSWRRVVGPGFWAILAAIGICFIGFTHFGPFAEDPPALFVRDYGGDQTKALLATIWLWMFLASLFTAMVYSAWRWSALRQRAAEPRLAH